MHASARLVYPMGLLALALPAAPLLGLDVPLALPYAWHKALHVVGAILFLGNVLTGALWGTVAVARRDARLVAHTLDVVNWSDAVFTGPGVLLVMYNGLAMARALGGVGANRFTLWGLAVLWLVVALWLAAIVPAQHRIQRAAREAVDGAGWGKGYLAAVLQWSILGGLAGAASVAIAVVMVLKP